MVGVFFSAVVVAASSNQYDGSLRGGLCSTWGIPTDKGSVQWSKGKRRPLPTKHADRECPAARSSWWASSVTNERREEDGALCWAATWKRGEVKWCWWYPGQAGPLAHWYQRGKRRPTSLHSPRSLWGEWNHGITANRLTPQQFYS